jgi:hypothetical protein
MLRTWVNDVKFTVTSCRTLHERFKSKAKVA